jgi:hypothetical protein
MASESVLDFRPVVGTKIAKVVVLATPEGPWHHSTFKPADFVLQSVGRFAVAGQHVKDNPLTECAEVTSISLSGGSWFDQQLRDSRFKCFGDFRCFCLLDLLSRDDSSRSSLVQADAIHKVVLVPAKSLHVPTDFSRI